MGFYDKHKAHRIATKGHEDAQHEAMLAGLDPGVAAAFQQTGRALELAESLAPAVEVLGNDVAALKQFMGHNASTQKAGAHDLEMVGGFIKQAVAHRRGDLVKVADNLTIADADRGGYLVPTTVAPSVDALLRVEGSVLGACNFSVAEPGRAHRIPFYTNAPAAVWQAAEGGAMTEADVQIGSLERAPRACGGWVDVSHQLMSQSAHNIGNTFVSEMVEAIRQRVETDLIAGDAEATAPHDGLLEVDGAEEQSTMATATSALLSRFVAQSIADIPSLWANGVLLLAPAVAETIASEEAGSAYRGRFMIDTNGAMRFGRWPVLVSPAVGMNAIMVNPRHIHVVRSDYTTLIDDKSQIKNLLVTILFAGWFSYGFSYPGAISRTDITALS